MDVLLGKIVSRSSQLMKRRDEKREMISNELRVVMNYRVVTCL